MGLIREIEQISDKLSKSEINRIKKEQEKRLESDYKKDIKNTLEDKFLTILNDDLDGRTEKEKEALILTYKERFIIETTNEIHQIKEEKANYFINGNKWAVKKELKRKYNNTIDDKIEDVEGLFFQVFNKTIKEHKTIIKYQNDAEIEAISDSIKKDIKELLKDKKPYKSELLQAITSELYYNNILSKLGFEYKEDIKIKVLNNINKYINILGLENKSTNKNKKMIDNISTGWKLYGITKVLELNSKNFKKKYAKRRR